MMLRRILKALLIAIPLLWAIFFWILRNPFYKPSVAVTSDIRIDAALLEKHVRFLSELKPNRSYEHEESLIKARDYIVEQFKEAGFTEVELQEVKTKLRTYHNVIVRFGINANKDVLVVGAHYDAAEVDNPGADDNASGVAGLIELARAFKRLNPKIEIPIEFVAYTLEEPPFFEGPLMGSVIHADSLKAKGKNVPLMLSLEMIGYFSDEFLSQSFTMPLLYGFYPWTGNYVGVVGRLEDRATQAKVKSAMIANSSLPIYSISAPSFMPGIYYSDHSSYWRHDWPAVMITDTAFLRNHEYHKIGDTADRLNYIKMSEVVRGAYAALLQAAF